MKLTIIQKFLNLIFVITTKHEADIVNINDFKSFKYKAKLLGKSSVKTDVLTLELKNKLIRNILLTRCKLHAAVVISLQYMRIYKVFWYYNILKFR